MLAGELEAPVFLEVPVADHRAQGEDGFGAIQAPSGSGDVEPVADQVAACPFDDPGRDRPASRIFAAGRLADADTDPSAMLRTVAGWAIV